MLQPLNEDGTLNNSEDQSMDQAVTPKKQFIEPEITVPVDVLEATTFFQALDSGGT